MDWNAIAQFIWNNPTVLTTVMGIETVFWYKILKMLFSNKLQDLAQRYPIINTMPEWTEVDDFYHSKFVDHVEYCRDCDPQDEPCELGNQLLEDWKIAKEIEQC